ncbi:long-chain-fatty-acid-CoA ligase [Sodiomyces alkalinus F11]|uniref:Long-chain-fatty-acid-CoA ligase n=1 Tax=Sodiomyces alkalinus (strain CBS 110278 / VKM F-3762 / F11) TaxID=1314773 RepID=A0A3N2PPG2_SODAK|nr:long-chain-fatty-acid-CoA ligase [Sodiomyces alkalinus F11]ROT36246.1 long-chain-fatty-acid-CoA ligase [Sodiomyces alkalinus F11]
MPNHQTGSLPLHPIYKPPYTIEAPGYEKVPGETIPRRNPKSKDGLHKEPSSDVHTLYDIIKRSVRLYPNEPAVGSRNLVKVHTEKKMVPKGDGTEAEKEWQLFELTGYSFLTYTEFHQYILQLAYGLRSLGLSKGSRLHLFAPTHLNWFSLAHACGSQSMSIVTAYDSLGAAGLEHSLLQSDAEAMYIEPNLLKTASGPLKKAKGIKFIIYNDSSHFADGTEVDAFKQSNPDVPIYSVEEVRKLGEQNPVDPVEPTPESLFCIMYTSGSTGLPKGVPMTHENMLAAGMNVSSFSVEATVPSRAQPACAAMLIFSNAVTGLYLNVEDIVSPRDFCLAYLPLAHILELVLENIVLFIGGTIGYGNPRTLSDTSVRNCAGDMREFRPTVLVGVPQIWETIRKGVESKVNKSGVLTRSLFWGAFNYKSFMTRNHLPFAKVLDPIVFGKVRELTGGRLRFIFNGASGLAEGTRHFLSITLAPMVVGYGLTETGGNGALGNPLSYTASSIGPVPAAIDIKLVSVPELNYSADAGTAQGEIWMKGPAVFHGYFKNEEETKKAITPDGWFKTGDIGEFDSDGHLRVIDRLKNLVKLQGGEYIALEKLETAYRGSQFVNNIMVHADPEQSRPIAVIAPNEKVLAEEAQRQGVSETQMHSDAKVKSAVLKDLVAIGKKAGLSPLEIVSAVVLAEEEWTPASGFVTATQKVNRRVLTEHYKEQIANAFKRR